MAWNESGNGKNPWNNKKPDDEGPPDLEEILAKWKEKLDDLLGGGGKGSGRKDWHKDNNDENPRNLWIIIVIVLLVWGLFGLYIIQPAEKGVEVRFGEYTRTTNQGLNWHIPYPIETVYKVNVEQIRTATHKAIMLTQDENIVEIELVVQYRVEEASDYLFNVQDPDDTLLQATESALREVVGTSKMDTVLTSGRDEISIKTKLLVQEILNRYKAGQPPEAVQASFEDVIKAREDEERHKNKAQAYANEIKQRAGGTADRLLEEAQGYKAQVVERATGETQRFISVLREYEKAPDIMRQRLYLETMESVLSSTSKVLIDVKDSNNIMLLPLDNLLNKSHTPIVIQTEDSPKDLPLPQRLPSERSRDNSRNRGSR